jgi:hypothetical protein
MAKTQGQRAANPEASAEPTTTNTQDPQTTKTSYSETAASNIIVPRHVREQMRREQAAREAAGDAGPHKPPTTLADMQKETSATDRTDTP